jgi:hypothetical protein
MDLYINIVIVIALLVSAYTLANEFRYTKRIINGRRQVKKAYKRNKNYE